MHFLLNLLARAPTWLRQSRQPLTSLFSSAPIPTTSIQRDPIPEEARAITQQEAEILTWLLEHADPPARSFLDQVPTALASPGCTCGCPTIAIHVPAGVPSVDLNHRLLVEAAAYIGSDMIGVLLFQAGGQLTCLEFYDLSDISHPYGLPDPATLEVLRWPESNES